MAYATRADMASRFGDNELIMLTDRDRLGLIDNVVLDQALLDASAEIDGWGASRYSLPLANVPRVLVGACCDIARYRLAGNDVNESSIILRRFEDAQKLLKAISRGEVSFGLPSTQTPVTRDDVHIVGGVRVFSRDTLSDY